MKMVTTYRNKKVLVIGLAKSGANAARLLQDKLGAFVTATDIKPFNENPAAQALLDDGVRVITGKQPLALMDEDFSLVVKNPGIPYDNPLVDRAEKKHIPIITEPELAFEISEAPWIGITGTNGKTTTTTLIAEMLNAKRTEGKAYLAGNIGIPASAVAEKVTPQDTMVVELSSFQLAGTTHLRPHIAVLTNIYSAHLDYHKTRANYIAAKMKIVANQNAADFFVVNWDSPEWQGLSHQTKGQVVPFSRKQVVSNGAYLKDGELYFQGTPIIAAEDIRIPGAHNIENALAAIAAAKLAGQKDNDAIAHVLKTFPGVKHRMQYVETWQNRKIYNDSKATNIVSTEVALRSFPGPVVLIGGGLDRGFTFEKLIPLLKDHVRAMVVYGQTKKLMAATAKQAGIENLTVVDTLDEAVPLAMHASRPGDVVLFSPAAASWDQFHTFEERGDRFIADVNQFIKENPS
ncbi:UDP-N-acetylmuramoyl-L-alanine--D-glutamate ligase [Schleiferilactobacillus perolens]|nr:UDP-N-acetylmuramoyl-L-alanine--D-glutamate ligase [Schleiferilactobacillus perolens]MCI2171301.1 UDP-N-acetylmuramoyl-L-alanine--D-glutamate ligase [Schleiferilactobacillus perolens]